MRLTYLGKANKENPLYQLNEKETSEALSCIQQDKQFNLKTSYGYLYFIGGILSKLDNNEQYIFNQEKEMWIKC